jgi:hypothetical protein
MSQTEIFIETSDRRTGRVREIKFLGTAAEADAYCRSANGMSRNVSYRVVTRCADAAAEADAIERRAERLAREG